MRAFGVDHKAQGKGGQNRAGGGNVQHDRQALGGGADQGGFELALFVGRGGDGRDHHAIGRYRDLGAGQQFKRRQAIVQCGLPTVGGGVAGGVEHIHRGGVAGQGFGCRGQLIFAAAAWQQADQLHLVIIAQHFDGKARGGHTFGRGDIEPVAQAACVDNAARKVHRGKAHRLIRGGAGQGDDQAIGVDMGPSIALGQKAGRDGGGGTRLDHAGKAP